MTHSADDPARRLAAHSLEFSKSLARWRKLNGLKQSALAEMLGVSQSAVAHWERGVDLPSSQRLGRLKDMMSASLNRETTVDRAFIERQSAARAMINYEDTSLLAASAGFRSLWPDFSKLLGVSMLDTLVNESAAIRFDPEICYAARSGGLGIISGVSERHSGVRVDEGVLHRWHICFRHRDARLLVDMVYEPCAPDQPVGIHEFVHLDALERLQVL